jgi:hypothetical protein|tara:strand:+ start:353 stop:658 length:306 start_codon:yes stop_codon:yes gene_type:complete
MQLNPPLHLLRRQYPVDELDARREATLRGDDSRDLSTELTDSHLLQLWETLQLSPAPGHQPRPLVLFVSPEKLLNSLQVLAFLREVARLEVCAVSPGVSRA